MNQNLLPSDLIEEKQQGSQSSQRIALLIQYLGTKYHGWQSQPNYSTVQGSIEDAIAEVVKYPVRIHGAGRTDAGVHGAAQVAHFDVISSIPAHRWAKVLKRYLPEDTKMIEIHPRFDDRRHESLITSIIFGCNLALLEL